MSNIVIKVSPFKVFISPMGFHRYASEYLRAAEGFEVKDGFSPVPYYLVCRSLELSLKSFLLAKGVPKKKFKERSLGHDLEKVFEKAISMGIDEFISFTPNHKAELEKANKYYASKGFEYFEVIKATTGYKNLPDITVLSDLATHLVTKLDAVCLKASDGPI
jgi:hypothetical protein